MKPYYDSCQVTLYQGDVREVLAALPAESVHMAVTSPPYMGLRDYGIAPTIWSGDPACDHSELEAQAITEEYYSGRTRWQHVAAEAQERGMPVREVKEGAWLEKLPEKKRGHPGMLTTLAGTQTANCARCGAWRGVLGLEPTVELYVAHIVQVFRAVRRVLRKDGIIFVNLGDSYFGGKGSNGSSMARRTANQRGYNQSAGTVLMDTRPTDLPMPGLKPLDMMGVPWRVAFAMQADGWWRRSAIVWEKPNPMPQSMNGWRWEQHQVKLKSQDYSEYHQPGKVSSGDVSGGHRNRDAIGGVWQGGAQYADCPGCKKCEPNGGLVLRRGSWRPTSSYEYIFMFTKSATYYGDGEPLREANLPQSESRYRHPETLGLPKVWIENGGVGIPISGGKNPIFNLNSAGRNARDVWRFSTQSFEGAHFATFPLELPKRCILAGTSERGVCPKCGAPWARVVETGELVKTGASGNKVPTETQHFKAGANAGGRSYAWNADGYVSGMEVEMKTLGWRPTCRCDAGDPVPAVVLDPFVGSGTTCLAATQLGRHSIGVDLSEDYLKMASERCRQLSLL